MRTFLYLIPLVIGPTVGVLTVVYTVFLRHLPWWVILIVFLGGGYLFDCSVKYTDRHGEDTFLGRLLMVFGFIGILAALVSVGMLFCIPNPVGIGGG